MIRKSVSYLLIFFGSVLLLSVTSCVDQVKKAEREEQALISSYIANNPDLAFEKKSSGLYYLEVQAGQGRFAVKNDTAYMKYVGKLLNGTEFYSTYDSNDTTFVRAIKEGQLILGLVEGLTYMQEGGHAIFLIPSYLAYGSTGYYFPGYTPVIFEVALVALKEGLGK